jgi:hypothetical protein
MFESYSVDLGWKGTHLEGTQAQNGVYVWQIEFGDNNSDKRHRNKGHITLLR